MSDPGDGRAVEADADGDGAGADHPDSVGVPLPEEMLGAFVAEVFEDPERHTAWDDVVDAAVAAEARDAWDDLSSTEQVEAVLEMADDYDERAVELLERVPTDRDRPTDRVDALFEEAARCRRNADQFRDGVADAYGRGHVDDDDLVAAMEAAGFDTTTVAVREERLEEVATAYGYDFRPYGGTLLSEDQEGPEGSHDLW